MLSAPLKPWEMDHGILRRSPNNNSGTSVGGFSQRGVPPLPPKPQSSANMTNNYIPYGGGYSSYGSMPYRGSLYNTYGGYGSTYGGYGSSYGGFGSNYGGYNSYGMNSFNSPYDDAERRFIQFAEENSRNTFASVENVVRAFNSIAMMLDNTFFAMTSSFRAVLSVAENVGRLKTVFGHIWYSLNIFRLLNWLYRKVMRLFGVNVPVNARQAAWTEAAGALPGSEGGSSNWPTIAFFGFLISAPYLIKKMLPKYEDKGSPDSWKSPGTRAKVAFDFVANNQSEMSIHTNDEVLLAPGYIQSDMKLLNTGWAFAVCNGKSGIIPLNYLVQMKRVDNQKLQNTYAENSKKRVSFGENQIFESTDPPLHKIPIKNEKVTRNADDEELKRIERTIKQEEIENNMKITTNDIKISVNDTEITTNDIKTSINDTKITTNDTIIHDKQSQDIPIDNTIKEKVNNGEMGAVPS